jgi:hypothetical protein
LEDSFIMMQKRLQNFFKVEGEPRACSNSF